MGTSDSAINTLSFICRRYQRPVIIDADGLNGIAKKENLLSSLPPFSILTPHPKEFDRLFGEQANDFNRLAKAREAALQYKLIIVLKGHHTSVSTPGGITFFNTTGNAGMAKGGSGDVLTGVLTALLAQGYQPIHAALLGVWLHGAAGDKALSLKAFETVTATDLIDGLSFAFRRLYPNPLANSTV
jgi:NAD(P)H-hydrate epimerase